MEKHIKELYGTCCKNKKKILGITIGLGIAALVAAQILVFITSIVFYEITKLLFKFVGVDL